MTTIVIDAVDPDTTELWRMVVRIATSFEDRGLKWCLVGGLMVALFALEARQLPRVTTDIDILGDARTRPSGAAGVVDVLRDLGASGPQTGGIDGQRGFRFEIDGQDVDVLAPDGLRGPAMLDAQFQTIEIPGGTQALDRTEAVHVILDGRETLIRRPTLLGMILLKAREVAVRPSGASDPFLMIRADSQKRTGGRRRPSGPPFPR